jgi:hypothetical protein
VAGLAMLSFTTKGYKQTQSSLGQLRVIFRGFRELILSLPPFAAVGVTVRIRFVLVGQSTCGAWGGEQREKND